MLDTLGVLLDKGARQGYLLDKLVLASASLSSTSYSPEIAESSCLHFRSYETQEEKWGILRRV